MIRISICIALTLVFSAHALGQPGVLKWSSGDELPGEMTTAEDASLKWKSPLFKTPLQLDVNRLESVTFETKPASDRQTEPFRIVMKNGNVLYGDLESISPNSMVVKSARHGNATLLRDQIVELRRMNNPNLIFLGPSGLEHWKSPDLKSEPAHFTATETGEITTIRPKAEIFTPLDLPEQVEIELVVSSTDKPRFLFALDSKPKRFARVETWDDELVAISGDEFEPLITLERNARRVQLRLYWNRTTSELSVYSSVGEKLATMKAAPPTGGQAGIYLQNKGAQLTLEKLRVSKWNGDPPQAIEQGEVRLHTVEGDIVYGKVDSYQKKTGELSLIDSNGARRIAMDEVDSIYLSTSLNPPADAPMIRVHYPHGGVISGDLISAENGDLTLKTSYSTKPITSTLTGVHKMQFRAQPPERNDGLDHLYCEGGKLRGTLVGGEQKNTEIHWRPVGGLNASALNADGKLRIVLGERNGAALPYDPAEFSDLLYLSSRDIVPCRIDQIDAEFIHLKTAFAERTRISHEQIRAIEFGSEPLAAINGFDSPNWKLTGGEKNVSRADDSVALSGGGAIGHKSAMRGDEISFKMTWPRQTAALLTVYMFVRDIDEPKLASGVAMLCTGDCIYCTTMLSGQPLGFNNRGVTQGIQGEAKIKLMLEEEKVLVYVNDKKSYTFEIPDSGRNGAGMILTTGGAEQIVGQTNARITITEFKSKRGSSISARRFVDAEARDLALTVPRFRKKNPPAQIVIAPNGDLLRGRLNSLTHDTIHFQSRLDEFKFPRDRVAAIVWLDPPESDEAESADSNEEPPEPVYENAAASESPVPAEPTAKTGPLDRIIMRHGEILVIRAEEMKDEEIIGWSEQLGRCAIPLAAIAELQRGYGEIEASGYEDWVLKAAPEPRFAASDGGADGGSATGPLVNTEAEDFKLATVAGEPFSLSDHRGKVVVLDFWASWCGPCLRAMPGYIEALSEFKKEDVVFVAVNQAENKESVAQFCQDRGWKMTIALDADQAAARKFKVEGIPHTVVVDQAGKISWAHVGFKDGAAEQMKTHIEKLLEPKGAE